MNGNQKKAAIVTGASSGIGKAIAEMLVSLGYEVFGFGREFTTEVSFHPVVCDLFETPDLERQIKQKPKQNENYII